jgi:hypothetical protein
MLDASDRDSRAIARARLALALVSARAHQCPNKRCGRVRHCLGAMKLGHSIRAPMGDCRNMSAAEWRVVSLGIMRNAERQRRFFRQQDALLDAALDAFPKAERAELRAAIRRAGEPAGDDKGGVSYWSMLWLEDVGGRLVAPPGIVRANAEIVAYWAKRGVRSAVEGEWGDAW